MSEHTPREAALKIIYMLQKHDHVAYLAGGCVRDRVMGLEPKAHDIATAAHPERIRELIPNSQFIGEAFGVVLVRMYGYVIEVATFRSESGYSDHRHPDHVDFTDARTDAMRRDFTINGLFENLTWVVMFDRTEGIRLTHSPSGGGSSQQYQTANPASDFPLIVPNYQVQTEYGFKARLVYRQKCSRQEILDEYYQWRKLIDPGH